MSDKHKSENMSDEAKIEIVIAKAQHRIYSGIRRGPSISSEIGEIEKLGDVVVSPPSYENIHINRKIYLEKVCMSDDIYYDSLELNKYIDNVVKMAILVLNEEFRVECPKKFAGQVIYLGESTIDNRNFCFIYGFGN